MRFPTDADHHDLKLNGLNKVVLDQSFTNFRINDVHFWKLE